LGGVICCLKPIYGSSFMQACLKACCITLSKILMMFDTMSGFQESQ
jgi:hypothetical protein